MSTAPIILYSNELENASSITVTSEATGYAKENAYDWLTWDSWKPTAAGTVYYYFTFTANTSIDAWGAFAHDLGTNSASIQLQYSTTGAWAGEESNFGVAVSPTGTEPFVQYGTAANVKYYRWEIISASAASSIGGLMGGARMDMQEGLRAGYSPDTNKMRYEYLTTMSEGGARLGGSKRKVEINGTLHFDLLTRAWVETNFEPFIRHLEAGKGFLYLPDPDNYPLEVTYGWIDKNFSGPVYQLGYWGTVDVRYMGIVD